jgi:hypothetical protein
VTLLCTINNPRDDFTNLTVTWFRSITEDTSIFDEIPTTSEEYGFFNFVSGRADNSLSVINCSHELLYRDLFSLIIFNVNRNKNGYYWCQLSINNTLAQPSHRAQFSVGECITDHRYYRLANLNENQCAEYVATESDSGLTTTIELSGTSSIISLATESIRSPSVTQQEKENVAIESEAGLTTTNETPGPGISSAASSTDSLTRSSSETQQEKESDTTIIHVAGSLTALLLIALLGVLALAFSFAFYVHHQRKKTSKLHRSTCYIKLCPII